MNLNLGIILRPFTDVAWIRRELQSYLDARGEVAWYVLEQLVREYTDPHKQFHLDIVLVDFGSEIGRLWGGVPVRHDFSPEEMTVLGRLMGSKKSFGNVAWPIVTRAMREELGSELEVRANLAGGQNEISIVRTSLATVAVRGKVAKVSAAA